MKDNKIMNKISLYVEKKVWFNSLIIVYNLQLQPVNEIRFNFIKEMSVLKMLSSKRNYAIYYTVFIAAKEIEFQLNMSLHINSLLTSGQLFSNSYLK